MVDPLDAADDDDDLLLLLDPADIPAVDCLPEGFNAEGGEEEEEELEWLSNKDAFPALETSFEASAGASAAIGAAATTPLLAPARPRSKRPRRRRRVFSAFAPETAAAAVGRRRGVAERRRCRHCEAEETPQWRAGPEGPKTLCNACGVRYKSGRLVPEYRPAASPSFSPTLHSNSHRRILEMRRRRATRPSHKGAPPSLPKL